MAIYITKPWYKPKKKTYQGIWVKKTWKNFNLYGGTERGNCVWTDGTNIFYSEVMNPSAHAVLDRATSTWSNKSWGSSSLKDQIRGNMIWTDGSKIYSSYEGANYVYKPDTSTFSSTSFYPSSFYGSSVWTDGTNIYYSYDDKQWILGANKDWSNKTWNGLTSFSGSNVWTDGVNIYYSATYPSTVNKVLDKSTDTWNDKTWNGLTSFNGDSVWTDGTNIYYTYSSTKKVLNVSNDTWSDVSWTDAPNLIYGYEIWKDGDHIYFSDQVYQYEFI